MSPTQQERTTEEKALKTVRKSLNKKTALRGQKAAAVLDGGKMVEKVKHTQGGGSEDKMSVAS